MDAGCGDGRVLAVLSSYEPKLDLVGIEHDAALLDEARQKLAPFGTRIRLTQGDFLAEETYLGLGLGLGQVDLVFHYPDGNETRLEGLLSRTPARLVLLSPDTDLRFSLLQAQLATPLETPRGTWRLLVSESSRSASRLR